MPRVKCPGEPTRSATLLYTEPMMFMFTVLPLRQARGELETYIYGADEADKVGYSYQLSYAELKAKHQV